MNLPPELTVALILGAVALIAMAYLWWVRDV